MRGGVCVYDKQLTSTRAHASHPRDQPQDPRHPHQPVKSEETSPHSLPHAKGAHTVDRARCQQEGAAEAAPQEPEAPTGAAPAEAAVEPGQPAGGRNGAAAPGDEHQCTEACDP